MFAIIIYKPAPDLSIYLFHTIMGNKQDSVP
jgi:hypothetical protein